MPNDVDLRVRVANTSVTLFYTKSSGSTNTLYREHVNRDFTNSDPRSTLIGINCGAVIRGNAQIIAVSCPTFKNGILSVYTLDLEHINTIEGKNFDEILFELQIN
jgi:hypothetical protein